MPPAPELDGEPTRLDMGLSEEATAIAPDALAPFLVCEKGPDLGKNFQLTYGEVTVGRSVDNEIVLTDLSVSRRHLKVRRGDENELLLIDLGSGNGSLLNGSRVKEAVLRDGDRIALGETVLGVRAPGQPQEERSAVSAASSPRVYLGTGAVARVSDADAQRALSSTASGRPSAPARSIPPAAPPVRPPMPNLGQPMSPRPTQDALESAAGDNAKKQRNMTILKIAGAVLVLGASVGAAILTSRPSSDAASNPAANGQEAAPKSPFEAGVKAFNAHQWDAAESAFRLVPDSPATRESVERYQQRIRDARIHETHFNAAKTQLAAGDARGALVHLGMIAADSPLSADAESLRRAARETLVAAIIVDAQNLQSAGRIEEARQKLTEASMLDPGNANVERTLAQFATIAAPQAPVAPVPVAPVPVAPQPVPQQVVVPAPRPQPTPVPAPTHQVVVQQPLPFPMATSQSGTSSHHGGSAHAAAAGAPSQSDNDRLILELYRAGDFVGAARKARDLAITATSSQRGHLTDLASAVDQFARDYSRVRSAGSNVSSVTRQLQSAIATDEKISSGTAYARQLKSMLLDAYLGAARDAWAREEWVTSCSRTRQAVELDGTNAAARDLATKCERKATELVAQGTSIDRSDHAHALELFRTAMLMVPQSSSTYRSASSHLGSGHRGDEDE